MENIYNVHSRQCQIENQNIHCVVLVDTDNMEYTPLANNTHYFSTTGDIICGKNETPMQSFKVDFTMVPAKITKNRTAGLKVINLFSEPFNRVEKDAENNS